MNLFVWDNGLNDCAEGEMLIALAENVEQARAEVIKECSWIGDGFLTAEPKVFDLDTPRAFVMFWGGG